MKKQSLTTLGLATMLLSMIAGLFWQRLAEVLDAGLCLVLLVGIMFAPLALAYFATWFICKKILHYSI